MAHSDVMPWPMTSLLPPTSTPFILSPDNANLSEDVCFILRNATEDDDLICNGFQAVDAPTHIVFVYAYVVPLLVALTLLTNLLVCVVLLRNTLSPTNVLLVAMAVSDTLTGTWPIPAYVYVFTAGRHTDWLPYSWCYAYFCLTDHLPTVFHTASIWLTVSLAVQRYVSVCHPLAGKRLCTVPNVLKAVAAIYALSLLSHICKFVELNYHAVSVTSRVDPAHDVIGCYETLAPLVAAHMVAYYNVYYWYRVVFIHLVPCTSLVMLNAILIHTMRAAQRRRSLLMRQNRRMESRRLEESNSTTMMLVAVVGLFLLVEVPLALFFLVYIWDNTFRETSAIPKQTVDEVSMSINFFILLSYPLNFFIYCGMSRQFRDTFRRLFSWGASSHPSGPNATEVTVGTTLGPGMVGGGVGGRGRKGNDEDETEYVTLQATYGPPSSPSTGSLVDLRETVVVTNGGSEETKV